MPTYILVLTLTPEGRQMMLDDAESLMRAEEAIVAPDLEVLGLYGVLGEYDFVSIVEAPDSESPAAFSLELGGPGRSPHRDAAGDPYRTLRLRSRCLGCGGDSPVRG